MSVLGQTVADTIEIRRNTFRIHGQVLKPRQLLDALRRDPAAYEEMRIAKRKYDYGSAFGFAGRFLVGLPLGAAVAGGEPNWVMAGVGAGLIVASIPFASGYKRHALSAVATFNEGLRGPRSQLRYGTTTTGLGLVLHF